MNTAPIEFMAWDVVEGCFIPQKEFAISANGELITVDNWASDYVKSECYVKDPIDVEFMQLTSLRSINDEPIYNHMIVRDELGDYYLVDMFNYDLMFMLSENHIEIVGNRFQNSELLELCK